MNNIITTEERFMMRDYILLQHIEKMVENSISEIECSANVLNRAYLMAGHYIQNEIIKDRQALSKELRKRDIKITNEESSGFVIYYGYTCRGYVDKLGLTRDVMRSEISILLTKYTSELGDSLKKIVR